ncbi:MAG: hypothetical protein D6761_09845 [Candidatus Dadabacteria bacterium]|nr:MAG: hypothetical protein D6761_09845 [Candidatus Dadabacteria bacterium]
MHRWDGIVRIWQTVVPWAGWVLISLFAWLSIRELAGHVTIANIKILAQAMSGGESPCPAWYLVVASVMLGLGGVWFGRRERRLRKDTIERLHPYQRLWEERSDPDRSSSNLTPRGDTRPEDR